MSGRIFRSFAVGGFTIIPEGEPLPANGGVPLIMGKKGAFGSGEHETTVSCLEVLERLPGLRGMRVLDLGSGTGILAIAAARLGAGSVVAVDIDERAADSCTANVRLNGVADRVAAVCGELSCIDGEPFDLLLANIYADIHLALAEEMTEIVRTGGLLLLSGIPIQDKFDVQLRFQRLGCRLLDMRILEEYVTLLMERG
jgi:ribosomal protein L11 methyltransferase